MPETPQQRLEEIKTKMKSVILLYKSHTKIIRAFRSSLGFS